MNISRNHRKKIIAAATAATLTITAMFTGTFAWQSINQEAKNEMLGQGINPGGRLHDDFNGQNKDVYVENFTDPEDHGVPIFARIRLDEYMELGEDAGKNTADPNRKATSLVAGATIGDVTTWTTHIPDTDDTATCPAPTTGTDKFHDYWAWTMGGQTVYMPTFNKNKDSLTADINGTYAGIHGIPYDDYVTYQAGDSHTGNAVYDIDADTVDEAAPVEGVDIETVQETHTAAQTKTATVITMAQWKAGGCQLGDFWVYDVDGWAYWANPIQPGETTGLLLDEVQQVVEPTDNWYYAINVVAQFATAGDWGQEDQTGFYDTTKGVSPTADALFLLNKAAALLDVTIRADGDATRVEAGSSLALTATVGTGSVTVSDPQITWTILDAHHDGTHMDGNKLVVSADETATELTIRATAPTLTSRYGQYTVTITKP